jgi:K+/H+ antiporter YhaU regulatory subunit KhtT
VFLTEGVNVFRRKLPPALAGQTIAASQIRPRTGCSIVAIEHPGSDETLVVPPPETVLDADMVLILIGSPAQEEQFGQIFPASG